MTDLVCQGQIGLCMTVTLKIWVSLRVSSRNKVLV
jgi:hypothetical protein